MMGTTDQQIEQRSEVTPRRGFFSYSPDNGFDLCETREAAIASATEALEAYRDDAPDGWSEEVSGICWGEVLGRCRETERRPLTDEDRELLGIGSDITEYVDYGIEVQPADRIEEPSELALMKLALELIWRIHLRKHGHLGPERQSGIENDCVPCICALMLGRGFGRQPTERELRERLASFGDHHG